MIAWSYGGGVQSVAIGVLIKEGALPKPDLVAICDTGREKRTTWEYLADVMQPYLEPAGVKIEVIPHSLARVDMYDKDGLPLMPAYTDEGRLGAFCSGEWKRDTFERWLRLQGVAECNCWIGFSMDEVGRAKNDHRPWCMLEFPLIDRFINRAMCVSLIKAAGLPVPLKSRCYCCPHQSNGEWAEVQSDADDWALAVEVDKEVHAADPQGKGLYLWSGRRPLGMADFAGNGIVSPGRPCESGFCWT